VAEGAPLLREYGLITHRGFESLPLRQFVDNLLIQRKSWSPRTNRPPAYSPVHLIEEVEHEGGVVLRLSLGLHGRHQAATRSPSGEMSKPVSEGANF
jgi:hypothetical protein